MNSVIYRTIHDKTDQSTLDEKNNALSERGKAYALFILQENVQRFARTNVFFTKLSEVFEMRFKLLGISEEDSILTPSVVQLSG